MTETAPAFSTRTPGADFEAMPYTSHPFADTVPDHLASIAALVSFAAPAPQTARVVELGCASGGNIIPLALRYPQARFLGVDLSRRHVELAQARIAALGLTNIEVRQGDIGEVGLIEGEWDYVLCHGVFSWVETAVQEQILRTCHDILSPKGLAYISYNVLPGWHMRSVVRDIFLFDDDADQDAAARVARGRWLLEQLAEGTEEGSHYGAMLRAEAMTLAKQPDNYIMAEFLVEENQPCYFHDFLKRAQGAGLDFLGEAKLSLVAPASVNPRLEAQVRRLAGPERVMAEQYRDFLTGRQFRQTILYRRDTNPGYRHELDAKPLTAMHFSAQLRPHPIDDKPDARHVKGADGIGFTTNDPAVWAIFDHMADIFPATASPRQLLERLAQIPDLDRSKLSERVMQALMQTVLAGLSRASVAPIVTGRADDDRPMLWPLARQEMADGQTWLTNLAHKPVALDAPARRLVPLLNGSRDRTALEAAVAEVLSAEADALGLLNVRSDDPAQIAAYTEALLEQVARLGLLAPQASST